MIDGSYVYILTNKPRGTLYTGVTADLIKRIYLHRSGMGSQFAHKFALNTLVWFATFDDIENAISHEKRVKRWRRAWKIELIEERNPRWEDLYLSLTI